MQRKLMFGIATAVLLFSCACSQHKQIDSEEMDSQLTAAVSLASESEMFLRFAADHRAPQHFTEGHLEYLREAVDKELKELSQAAPSADVKAQFTTCKSQLSALQSELDAVHGRSPAADDLRSRAANVQKIRTALQDAKAAR